MIINIYKYTNFRVLMNAGYTCECRGPTYVKGKGTLVTYFVKTPNVGGL